MITNKFNFNGIVARFKLKKRDLPTIIANDSRNFFLKSFKISGWDDGTVSKWPKRKSGGDKPTLIRTGKLRRAVANAIRKATWEEIRLGIGSEVPYAQFHNEGAEGTVNTRARSHRASNSDLYSRRTKKKSASGVSFSKAGSHERNLPQRKFMGPSKTLTAKTKERIRNEIKSVFK